MKLNKDQFRTLQELWYNVLAESGFHDIEQLIGGKLVLKRETFGIDKRYDTLESVRQREEYYRFMGHMVNDPNTTFKNDLERFVLSRHADGLKNHEIVRELALKGTPRHRHAVRFIIRRYLLVWKLNHS